MKYNELILTKQKTPRRSGRGISAGRGKTAGRGTKGQGARKSPNRAGFEGGQMPLYMRLPKLRGFKSHRDVIETVYTGQLDQIKKSKIDNLVLFEAGLVSSPNTAVKLLLKGDVASKVDVSLQGASQNAQAAVGKAGGSFSKATRVGKISQKTAKSSKK